MSQFPNVAPEPKKVFLDLLIRNADYLGQLIATSKYTDAVNQMLRITTDIIELAPKEKIKPLYEKLENWMFNQGNFTNRDVQKAHLELKMILQTHLFSELQIGIIPTSTLAAEKAAPKAKPLNAASNKI